MKVQAVIDLARSSSVSNTQDQQTPIHPTLAITTLPHNDFVIPRICNYPSVYFFSSGLKREQIKWNSFQCLFFNISFLIVAVTLSPGQKSPTALSPAPFFSLLKILRSKSARVKKQRVLTGQHPVAYPLVFIRITVYRHQLVLV